MSSRIAQNSPIVCNRKRPFKEEAVLLNTVERVQGVSAIEVQVFASKLMIPLHHMSP